MNLIQIAVTHPQQCSDQPAAPFSPHHGSPFSRSESSDVLDGSHPPPHRTPGDLARSYFYLATAYWRSWACCVEPGITDRSYLAPLMEAVMREWHALDPVDSNERARNNAIHAKWQGNRNPYIDHPEWVASIASFGAPLPAA